MQECVVCDSRLIGDMIYHRAGCQESDPKQRQLRRANAKQHNSYQKPTTALKYRKRH